MQYNAKINKELLLKLNQSLKGGFKANKTLCKLIGVDYDNIQERTAVFLERKIEIKDYEFRKLRLMVNLKHNERSWDIQWEYHGRVGNVRAGDLIRKSYGSYPQLQVDPALTLYREIAAAFAAGTNYFALVKHKASLNDTIAKQYPNFLLSRKQAVKDGQLDEATYINDVARWHNHIKSIAIANGQLFSRLAIRSVKRTDIIKLIELLKRVQCYDKKKKRFYQRGSSVINAIVANIKSFFEWADDHGLVDENSNPVYRITKLEINARSRVVNYKDLGIFMDYLLHKYTRSSERVRLAIYLTWYSGQRVGEVLKMKWEDIKEDQFNGQQVIIFNKKGRRKNDKKGKNLHPVYLTDDVLKVLKTIPRLKDNPYVFWTARERRLKRLYMASGSLNDTINKVCVELGMERFTPHDIKRSTVTHDYYVRGSEAVKLTTGNKSDRVLQDHYLWSLNNGEVEEGMYEQMKTIGEERHAEINSHMQQPLKPTDSKVIHLIPKQTSDRSGVHKIDKVKAFEEKIKRKYGVSKSVYYRRKKEGYYDKKA